MLNLESRGAAQSTRLSLPIYHSVPGFSLFSPADGTSRGRAWFLGMSSSHTITSRFSRHLVFF